jgi:hypothetical protein
LENVKTLRDGETITSSLLPGFQMEIDSVFRF